MLKHLDVKGQNLQFGFKNCLSILPIPYQSLWICFSSSSFLIPQPQSHTFSLHLISKNVFLVLLTAG